MTEIDFEALTRKKPKPPFDYEHGSQKPGYKRGKWKTKSKGVDKLNDNKLQK